MAELEIHTNLKVLTTSEWSRLLGNDYRYILIFENTESYFLIVLKNFFLFSCKKKKNYYMKINLIIDGNYRLYSNVYSLHKNKTLYGDLYDSLKITFDNYIVAYPWDKIFVVSDNKDKKLWRKNIFEDYKGNRKKAEDIDWDFVFETFDNFKEELMKSKRFNIIEVPGAEGDDIIATLVKMNNDKGEGNVIVASDGDIHQLMDYRLNPLWMNIQWKDQFMQETVYVPRGYQIMLDKIDKEPDDIFNPNDNKRFLHFMKSFKDKATVKEVNKEQEMFLKIIHGDKQSDNIPSVCITKNKSGNDVGIGKAGAEKIYEKFKNDYPQDIDFDNDEWIEDVMAYCAEYKKVDYLDVNIQTDIINNIKRNRKLTRLNEMYFPADIRLEIKNKITECLTS